jgi:hypothetical protein
MHFLTNHPELLDDITETLKLRQHDSEEAVRYEVVIAIVSTAKKDFDVVSQSEDLLNFVKVRKNLYGAGTYLVPVTLLPAHIELSFHHNFLSTVIET